MLFTPLAQLGPYQVAQALGAAAILAWQQGRQVWVHGATEDALVWTLEEPDELLPSVIPDVTSLEYAANGARPVGLAPGIAGEVTGPDGRSAIYVNLPSGLLGGIDRVIVHG